MYETYFSSRGVDPKMYMNAKLPQYIKFALGEDKRISILDVGCGFGQNLWMLQQEGFENISGIDISDEAIKFCSKKGFTVKQCDIMDYQGKKSDFILMSHILEHLPKNKVISVLRYIRENVLSENGSLCILVPNAQSNTDCYWAYEDFTHNMLFTAGSLLFVLREAGFKKDKIEFLDADGLALSKGWKKIIRRVLLALYKKNKVFWNKVTGSAYHQPSPVIFTWELKCIAHK